MAALASLPTEVIRNIALHLYDPLEITQQDHLTWGIFSTVDMDPARQERLLSLVSFGSTCRAVRAQVRVILFRCIRVPSMDHLAAIASNHGNWSQFVKSVIIDFTLFDDEALHGSDEFRTGRRSCFKESDALIRMFNNLPNLAHVCFFADSTDDATLSLVTRELVSPACPPVQTHDQSACSRRPFTTRLKSLSWRQRQKPPADYASYSANGIFMSLGLLLRHAINLNHLVLDADMDQMTARDVEDALGQLAQRVPSPRIPLPLFSLTLCGPIEAWDNGLVSRLVPVLKRAGLKELYLDRPVHPLLDLHHTGPIVDSVKPSECCLASLLEISTLDILQLGSYRLQPTRQIETAIWAAEVHPNLKVLALWGLDGETNWWAIWRKPTDHVNPPVEYAHQDDKVGIAPLGDGHLQWLLEPCAVDPVSLGVLPTINH